MTGFEAASRLRDAASSAAILLASSRERSDFGPLIVDSGANGFVQKEQLSGETSSRRDRRLALSDGKGQARAHNSTQCKANSASCMTQTGLDRICDLVASIARN